MKNILGILVLTSLTIGIFSCKKTKDAHVPPDVEFKTGSGYTSSDATVAKSYTVSVGITATKTEDNLHSYNVSYAYDGATTTTTFYNYYLAAAEYTSYTKDIQFVTRNQTGTEKWTFSIVDRDGNITQKSITLTVQ